MKFPRLTVIPVDMTNLELLAPIQRMDFLTETEIHFVHVVRKMDYTDGIGFNLTFPFDQDLKAIQEAVLNKLKAIAPETLPYGHIGQVKFHCLFGFEPKKDFCKYLDEVQADLVVISSRATHGILESSFAYYVSRYAQCNVLMIKS
jgi:nucleotide-binding universal stress UspA family protein